MGTFLNKAAGWLRGEKQDARRIPLRRGDEGVLYKFFDKYKTLVVEVAWRDRSFDLGDVLVPEHPDPELLLEYTIVRAAAPREHFPVWKLHAQLLGEPPSWAPRASPRTHDYTWEKLSNGHNVEQVRSITGATTDTGKWFGWGIGLRKGDIVLLSKPRPLSHVVQDLEYSTDPEDMWFATLVEQSNA